MIAAIHHARMADGSEREIEISDSWDTLRAVAEPLEPVEAAPGRGSLPLAVQRDRPRPRERSQLPPDSCQGSHRL